MKSVSISFSDGGMSVVVDGQDISDICDFVGLSAEPSASWPIVTVGIRASSLKIEGDVQLETMKSESTAEAIGRFLESVDAADIESRSLENELMDEPHGATRSIIQVLKEQAHGD